MLLMASIMLCSVLGSVFCYVMRRKKLAFIVLVVGFAVIFIYDPQTVQEVDRYIGGPIAPPQ